MVKHNELTEYHPAFIVAPIPPTTLSLGYPLRVGVEWLDTSGGIGVLRRCVEVDGGGGGIWVLDGPAVVKLPLGDSDAPGGVLAWQNPEGVDILVTDVILRETTSTADVGDNTIIVAGVAPDATTRSYSLSNGLSTDNGGSPLVSRLGNFKPQVVAVGEWVTISADVGSSSVAGLAGYAYPSYCLA